MEISIVGPIGEQEEGAKSTQEILNSISGAEARGEDLIVNIDSNGGNLFDGFAIYDRLKSYKYNVTTRINSLAASMASIIFCAGKKREMGVNTWVMIHNPSVEITGDYATFRNASNTLERFRDQMAKIYTAVSKKLSDSINDIMDAETWYTANDAVNLGLATGIFENPTATAKLDRNSLTKPLLYMQIKPVPAVNAVEIEIKPEDGKQCDVPPTPSAPTEPTTETKAVEPEEKPPTIDDLIKKIDDLTAIVTQLTKDNSDKKAALEQATAKCTEMEKTTASYKPTLAKFKAESVEYKAKFELANENLTRLEKARGLAPASEEIETKPTSQIAMTVTRAQFDDMDQVSRRNFFSKGGKIV